MTNVFTEFPVGGNARFPLAAVKEAQVTTRDGMALLFQQVDKVRANVTSVTSQEYSQCFSDSLTVGHRFPVRGACDTLEHPW